ncbi:uncharacterized protein LOC124703102 isoform X1 [Lolium rigidum]|uniref:uncharacterized protein LOC124684755 isoform X1 n=1 Tax=Lolium rigidum TaxID=89674 RepID=UPI001F5CCB58|nr:uncharacterized protein LOC124684755 isoform X1 [Lolium rigidum]XP_047074971.1 uncharacterized protein LOC124684755 isoform X1 [Lolium rigidum]XP_047074975.1 uncharacterized protein LOC124684755 isoform X1 [Lolium rigidum]XP_047074976.1 uncharacterized protein LOC124684755 isoform X1 [Lolium rigidum]XP_047091268.1 uncharacterized protein LOC124703102 isoform X1 [Lolium rigidum]
MDVVFGELMIDGGRDEADYISGDGIVGGGFATLHRISLCGGCVARFAADWDQVRVIEDLGECGDAHRPSLMQNITALPTLPSLSRRNKWESGINQGEKGHTYCIDTSKYQELHSYSPMATHCSSGNHHTVQAYSWLVCR